MKLNKGEINFITVVAASLLASTAVIEVDTAKTCKGDLIGSRVEIITQESTKESVAISELDLEKEVKEAKEELVKEEYIPHKMYVNCSILNVRSKPDTDSKVLTTLNYRDSVVVIGEDNGWSIISYNKDSAYISSKYLVENKPDIALYKCRDHDGSYYQLSEELQKYTYETCVEYGIPEHYELILAQMMTETHYVEGLVSATRDHGLMQINESNHGWLSEDLGFTDFDNSKNSIEAGIYIMSGYLKEYSVSESLSKYNTGTAYNSTEYSRKVLSYLDRLERIN